MTFLLIFSINILFTSLPVYSQVKDYSNQNLNDFELHFRYASNVFEPDNIEPIKVILNLHTNNFNTSIFNRVYITCRALTESRLKRDSSKNYHSIHS